MKKTYRVYTRVIVDVTVDDAVLDDLQYEYRAMDHEAVVERLVNRRLEEGKSYTYSDYEPKFVIDDIAIDRVRKE